MKAERGGRGGSGGDGRKRKEEQKTGRCGGKGLRGRRKEGEAERGFLFSSPAAGPLEEQSLVGSPHVELGSFLDLRSCFLGPLFLHCPYFSKITKLRNFTTKSMQNVKVLRVVLQDL